MAGGGPPGPQLQPGMHAQGSGSSFFPPTEALTAVQPLRAPAPLSHLGPNLPEKPRAAAHSPKGGAVTGAAAQSQGEGAGGITTTQQARPSGLGRVLSAFARVDHEDLAGLPEAPLHAQRSRAHRSLDSPPAQASGNRTWGATRGYPVSSDGIPPPSCQRALPSSNFPSPGLHVGTE